MSGWLADRSTQAGGHAHTPQACAAAAVQDSPPRPATLPTCTAPPRPPPPRGAGPAWQPGPPAPGRPRRRAPPPAGRCSRGGRPGPARAARRSRTRRPGERGGEREREGVRARQFSWRAVGGRRQAGKHGALLPPPTCTRPPSPSAQRSPPQPPSRSPRLGGQGGLEAGRERLHSCASVVSQHAGAALQHGLGGALEQTEGAEERSRVQGRRRLGCLAAG